jgi:hypothetical protein
MTGSRSRLHLAILSRVVLIVSGLLLPQSARAGFEFALDYSTLNKLPSATGQGLNFVSGSYLGSTESQAFQVETGLLHITTPNGYSLDKGGGYQLDNGYDHLLDLEYKFTARVTAGDLGALQFTFRDSTYSGGLGIGPGSFYIPGVGNSLNLGVDPSQYHTYDYVALAGTGKFTLTIDGNLAYSGNLVGGGTTYAYFGDPYDSNNSGYVTGDITSISYDNNNMNVAAVPEPASLVLAGLGAVLVGFSMAWRRAGGWIKSA